MPLTKKYYNYNHNTWKKGNILFILSLIILAFGILLLIIGYGIYPQSTKNISSGDDLITIPKIGHINIIKDSNKYFVFWTFFFLHLGYWLILNTIFKNSCKPSTRVT